MKQGFPASGAAAPPAAAPEEGIAALLESAAQARDGDTVMRVVLLLDNPDIRTRGEAFATLLINKNDISGTLAGGLDSSSPNIRASTALVLGNRGGCGALDHPAAESVARRLREMTRDDSALVRSCALGALGHLRADGIGADIRRCLKDRDLEVVKSALGAAIDTGCDIPDAELAACQNTAGRDVDGRIQKTDPELERLVSAARR